MSAVTAAELRGEAQHLREFAATVTDPEVLAELQLMIEECERRARAMGNGDVHLGEHVHLPAEPLSPALPFA